MEFTKIPLDSTREPSAEEKMQYEKMMSLLGSWEHLESAALDVFGVIVKHGLWDSADACKALFRISAAALPDWVSQNREKILSDCGAVLAELSELAEQYRTSSRQ